MVPRMGILLAVQQVAVAEYLEVCETAVRRAGKVLMDRIGRVEVRYKGPSDLVTDADIAAQEAIRRTVLAAFPDHTLVGEEDRPGAVVSPPASPYRWIADPLDGTTNYVHQVPFFGVSLALEQNGRLLVGAVYHPSADECFTAAVGKGAMRNGSPIHTSGVRSLRDALVSAGFPTVVEPRSADVGMFLAAVGVCQSLRRTGSAALNLAYVAAGRFDAAWSFSTKVWDVAAGALLIQEAGGVIVPRDGLGSPLKDGTYLAAANPQLHAELLDLAHRAVRGE
jgi:myo-inositol-1(or 4)-monophosphatase